MSGIEDLVAAMTRPQRTAPALPAFRYGTVTAVGTGTATVSIDGVTVAGVPLYCAGVVEDAQVLLLAQGADLIVIGVRQ